MDATNLLQSIPTPEPAAQEPGRPDTPDDWLPRSQPDLSELDPQMLQAALAATCGSGGSLVAQFEVSFARWLGQAHVVAVPSGTLGTRLALRAHGIGPGDEVITSAHGWQPMVHAVLLCGATPVFADINCGTGCLDPARAAAHITPRNKALLVGNVNGHPADWAAWRALATELHCPLQDRYSVSVGASVPLQSGISEITAPPGRPQLSRMAERALALPLHGHLSPGHVHFVVKTLKDSSLNVGAGAAIY